MKRQRVSSSRPVEPSAVIEAALSRCPMTSDLPPGDRARLRRIAALRRIRRGQVLFHEGEPCAAMFVVAEGLVKVFKLAPDGRERVLNVFRPCDAFAEAALFGDAVYPAGAQALAPGLLVTLPRAPLLALLHAEPSICLRILASLSVKLKVLAQRLEVTSFHGVAARLAAYLLAERREQGRPLVRLPLSKKDLAAYLAMSPETLSRLLAALRASGTVLAHGRHVRLVDPAALEEIATGRRLPAHDAA